MGGDGRPRRDGDADGDLDPAVGAARPALRGRADGAVERGLVGEVFERRQVEALVPGALRPSLDDRIRALLRKDLIRPSRSDLGVEEEYRFRHILIRDVAYETLPKHDRAVLHARFGDRLERTAGPRLAEVEEIVGYHLERAYRYRIELAPEDESASALATKAAARLASAGRRVHDTRWDVAGTVNLLSRAWDLVPAGHAVRLEIGPDLALALAEHGDFAAANDVADGAVDESRSAGDEAAATRARVALSLVRLDSDPAVDVVRAEAEADEAIAFLEAAGDDLGAARSWRLKAVLRHFLADHGGRVAAAERAAALARRAGAGWEEAQAMLEAGFGLGAGAVPVDECRPRHEALLREARTSGNRRLEADALMALALLAGLRGDLEDARSLLAECARLAEDFDAPGVYWAVRSQGVAMVEEWSGNLDAAEAAGRDSYELFSRFGETRYRSGTAAALAVVRAERGDPDEAFRLADEAESLGGPLDIMNLVDCGIARAKAHALRGDTEEAIAEAQRALAAADRSDDLARLQGRAQLALAEALRAAGRDDDAVAAARDALNRFERKGAIVLADRARAFLAEIGSPT